MPANIMNTSKTVQPMRSVPKAFRLCFFAQNRNGNAMQTWTFICPLLYLSINVEYGKIPVSYFKLVCMLIVQVTSYCIWLKTASRKHFKPVNKLHCSCITIDRAHGFGLKSNIVLGFASCYFSLAHTLVLYF